MYYAMAVTFVGTKSYLFAYLGPASVDDRRTLSHRRHASLRHRDKKPSVQQASEAGVRNCCQ